MKTVYAYVVADILHHGHINHLLRAKGQGDMLIVGVLTAKACGEMKPRPVMSLMERIHVVESLDCVDKVVIQKTYSPLGNVKTIKPDILAESTSHKKQPANKYVESYGGKVVALPYTEGISSSLIKERIINAHKKAEHG